MSQAAPAVAPLAEGWVQLFNGKDLSGWGQSDAWKVVDNVLTGSAQAEAIYLTSQHVDYANFHLRAEMRRKGPGAGFLIFRCSGPNNYDVYLADGLDGSLNFQSPWKWLDEKRNDLVKQDQWFQLELIANGPKLTTKIDGKNVASATDSTYSRGWFVLGLEPEKGPITLEFKKIEIKELPPSKSLLPPTFTNSIGMEFVIVPKGKSWLGGGKDKLGDKEVVIPADFYLGKYEVTQEEWEKVMGEHTSFFSRNGGARDRLKDIPDAELKRFPVEDVTWDQCQIFAAKLNKFEKETGWVYRLPTEAEWEYACRGGPMADKADSAFDFYLAKPTNTLSPEHANVTRYGADHKGLNRTCRVGSYAPNALGLYDMHGNVAEWCEDAVAADNAVHRARRGGGWPNPSEDGKAAFRTAGSAPDFSNNLGLRLARVPSGAPSPEAKTPPLAVAPFTDADVQRIAALPAAEQVEEVRKELMRRNPGFDGTVEHKIEDGVVTELRIVTDQVTDIAPIRVFNALRVLGCGGTWTNKANGQLADLTPLKAMNLASLRLLNLGRTKVTDAGMVYFKDCKNLKALYLDGTKVTDAGMVNFKDCTGLTSLRLDATKVTDSGLVHFQNCKDMSYLNLAYTQVSDAGLAHFKDCKNLTYLELRNTQVSDAGLAQLKGMALRKLAIQNTGVTDLTPLQGMPLEEIRLTPKNITRGLDILRDMKSLKTIGINSNQFWPAAEFWERYDKGEFGVAPFTDADVKRIAALPAAEQVEEVRKELMRRNPGFDGKLEHKIEDGVVTEFRIATDQVTDIAPIRVFNALRVLECRGTYTDKANGLLADLTPLEGMNLVGLTSLDLTDTKVTDAGMVYFKDCKNLTYLDLTNTKVTDVGLAHFKDCQDSDDQL